jgi:hypothetical protein
MQCENEVLGNANPIGIRLFLYRDRRTPPGSSEPPIKITSSACAP